MQCDNHTVAVIVFKFEYLVYGSVISNSTIHVCLSITGQDLIAFTNKMVRLLPIPSRDVTSCQSACVFQSICISDVEFGIYTRVSHRGRQKCLNLGFIRRRAPIASCNNMQRCLYEI